MNSIASELVFSNLYDEKGFYNAFLSDLDRCREELYIESPYITGNRIKLFYPTFKRLLSRGVKIYIVTRNPKDHENTKMRIESERAIGNFEALGIQPLLCVGNHHRKIALIDRKTLWEGSLNILSQAYSREIMRRTESKTIAMQMFDFLKLRKILD